ncbi:flagellar filament capping protein FliD [Aminipila terrae]|uniref:Flagellar filament capping protein FliD n=1 Tax=Aminipila terrae TaxID=2697030 RepID=A0A6P1MBB7_9FIRM|nr:flagellar filament capping protein FliD [Aminipila terrae]QHI71920.1 flagellar filament capping protein FliD [Aminipila terrae]
MFRTVQFGLKGKQLSFDLNGVSKTIEFTDADDATFNASKDINTLKNIISTKIDEKFGANRIKVDVANGTGLSFSTVKTDGTPDNTSILRISSGTADTLGVKGIFNLANGEKNRLDTSKTLKELGITASSQVDNKNVYTMKVNGVEFNFNDDTTIASVLSQINNSTEAGINATYLSTSGTFSVMADESGAQGKVSFEAVGGTGNLVDALFGMSLSTTDGQDMKMKIRYQGSSTDTEIVRSSNSVSIDGVNFTAKEQFTSATDADFITFTAKAETDDIVSALKSMTEDYNKILDSVNKLVTTKSRSNKRSSTVYEPLTEKQRKSMTADEIKTWEDKAKQGILFGDSTLSQLASDLRFVFSTAVSNVGLASSMGIKASSSYSDNGKITIDENKLKEALENDPEKVKALFTSTAEASPSITGNGKLAGGLTTRMKTIMESYAKSTGANKGHWYPWQVFPEMPQLMITI